MNAAVKVAEVSGSADGEKSGPAVAASQAPAPRVVKLPFGGEANMYTREQLTILYRCSHGELGRLLARHMAPLPIRIDGTILWHTAEVLSEQPQAMRTLERWRRR